MITTVVVVLLTVVAVMRGLPQQKHMHSLTGVKLCNNSHACVPYFLCPNGSINTDGTGLIDRSDNWNDHSRTTRQVKPTEEDTCSNYLDVCCKIPVEESKPISPKPIINRPPARTGCGKRHPDRFGFVPTVDSNKTKLGEFPWMVGVLKRIQLEDGSEVMEYGCGGALIHESVVLTAAQCVTRTDRGKLIARVGEWDTRTTDEKLPHQNINISKVIIHPDFDIRNLRNDFALLILEGPPAPGDHIGTVCLPAAPGLVPNSAECYATGWGKDKFGSDGVYQSVLRKVELPIVPRDRCVSILQKRSRLGNWFKLHESFVCAGGVIGKDTCNGAGGSPLVCPVEGTPGTYEVTGLVSWGIGCGSEIPGVYAGVAYALPWIEMQLKGLGISLGS